MKPENILQKESIKCRKKKKKEISTIDTIIVNRETHPEEPDNYEWLKSIIMTIPDELAKDKMKRVFTENGDLKEAIVEKLIMEII